MFQHIKGAPNNAEKISSREEDLLREQLRCAAGGVPGPSALHIPRRAAFVRWQHPPDVMKFYDGKPMTPKPMQIVAETNLHFPIFYCSLLELIFLKRFTGQSNRHHRKKNPSSEFTDLQSACEVFEPSRDGFSELLICSVFLYIYRDATRISRIPFAYRVGFAAF